MPLSLRELLKPHGLCNDVIGIIAKYVEMSEYDFKNHGKYCVDTGVDGIKYKTEDKDIKIDIDLYTCKTIEDCTCAGYYYFDERIKIDKNLM